ncbi:Biopolymer transport protein ExbD/TolR [Symmachiella macrocystis]|uniref:Biopolymer transport protein ExbD/TolR n=1 Tax=Symmachiella macrocystis TaxID=2527985 RepID=A0A5C6BHE9_9PLAN|nr:biopolymer transporter ExbD [Symmachiella macrocystis]TWU11553.1 Biopolymer transport protein ExbD/TolR [Symmachiella macrocystis]
MRFSKQRSGYRRIEAQMAPMIDVVFLLLIFFMLTLKVVSSEGDFSINMPIGAPAPSNEDIQTLPIKVRLTADENGQLAGVSLNNQQLGNTDVAFERLNTGILRVIGKPGNPLTSDMEVEIDADFGLHYRYTVQAISACTGKVNSKGQPVKYIEKIKFSQPRKAE